MLSYIQEYAPPGPPVGSTSFDFVTKSDDVALVRQGDCQAPWVKFSDAFLAAQSWTGQLGIGAESVRMPSTGKPKAAQGTDED